MIPKGITQEILKGRLSGRLGGPPRGSFWGPPGGSWKDPGGTLNETGPPGGSPRGISPDGLQGSPKGIPQGNPWGRLGADARFLDAQG